MALISTPASFWGWISSSSIYPEPRVDLVLCSIILALQFPFPVPHADLKMAVLSAMGLWASFLFIEYNLLCPFSLPQKKTKGEKYKEESDISYES